MKLCRSQWLLLSSVLLCAAASAPYCLAANARTRTLSKTSAQSGPQELSSELSRRLLRVEEFRFIREEAERLGVRAWLFGGTAAGYAHYVNWDLQRERGDSRFQPDRFDYDYTNIYRSTQDLDIVIDGSPEKAQMLQSILQRKYPHLQGSKSAWEVRLLTQDMGDKQALLNNPDFLNQHTDSNSTGMIEITPPPKGEAVVRDLRDWDSKEPHFLKDLRAGALHYYFSPLHETTDFYKKGRNPPILSAIRYLTKAFQYELKLRPEDLAKIQEVVDQFDPKAPMDSYVSNWIEKNGKKLIQNAVNIEYAVDTLDQLGLRNKLASIKGNGGDVESLSWWMKKEPLRSSPVGEGQGKTAAEIWKEAKLPVGPGGELVLGHETNTFLAYESITRAHTGDPNVLISRPDVAGEAAAYGKGFYTQAGRSGARGTGLTIRFELNPDAREGTDFTRHGNYILLQNKAAIRVIPESLNLGPAEYFDLLIEGSLSRDDLGILEKLKKRIGAKIFSLSKKEQKDLAEKVRRNLNNELVVREWFSMPISGNFPDILNSLIADGQRDGWIATYVLSHPFWKNRSDLVEALLKRKIFDSQIAKDVLSQPHWKDHPEWVRTLIRRKSSQGAVALYVLGQPHWKDHPELVKSLIRKGTVDHKIAEYVLSQPHWKDHPELVMALIKKGSADSSVITSVLSQDFWQKRLDDHPEIVDTLIKRGKTDVRLAQFVLSQPYSSRHPEWVKALIKRGKADAEIARYVLSQPQWKDHPELVEALLKKGTADDEIAEYVVGKPYWSGHPEWIETLLKRGKANKSLIMSGISESQWDEHPEWIERLIKEGKDDLQIAIYVLGKPAAARHPEWVKALLARKDSHWMLAFHALSKPHWSDHPEFIEELVQGGKADQELTQDVLRQPYWRDHPELRRISGGQVPTVENLRAGYKRLSSLRPAPPQSCAGSFAKLAGT